jgi:UDP-N-acetylmuramate dehydrogenase
MKGVQTGNIGSWPNQPLVLVNYGQGEASELELFANSIITIIYEKIEMKLEKEVNYIH